ncbi:MAG: hypothetical protein J0L57_11275, partial [Burkholderiales bacterium]|nr:hypothetical protein [Burkholderiales bacterium]
AQELQLYEAKRAEMNAAISIARQQLAQRQQELNEAQARRAQALLPGQPPRRTEPLRPVLMPPRAPLQRSLDLQPRGR